MITCWWKWMDQRPEGDVWYCKNLNHQTSSSCNGIGGQGGWHVDKNEWLIVEAPGVSLVADAIQFLAMLSWNSKCCQFLGKRPCRGDTNLKRHGFSGTFLSASTTILQVYWESLTWDEVTWVGTHNLLNQDLDVVPVPSLPSSSAPCLPALLLLPLPHCRPIRHAPVAASTAWAEAGGSGGSRIDTAACSSAEAAAAVAAMAKVLLHQLLLQLPVVSRYAVLLQLLQQRQPDLRIGHTYVRSAMDLTRLT